MMPVSLACKTYGFQFRNRGSAGFSTKNASMKTRCFSGERLITQFDTMVSMVQLTNQVTIIAVSVKIVLPGRILSRRVDHIHNNFMIFLKIFLDMEY